MNNESLKKEFECKIAQLRQQFNDSIIALEQDFYSKLNCATPSGINVTKNPPVFNYTLSDSSLIDIVKGEYKRSSKHVYYSLNVLLDKYLECKAVGKQNGSARWFKQMLVYYPDQVNTILSTIHENLIDNYEKILDELGFIKQEPVIDTGFDELVTKLKLLKSKNRFGRYRVALNKAKRLYPDKIKILEEI